MGSILGKLGDQLGFLKKYEGIIELCIVVFSVALLFFSNVPQAQHYSLHPKELYVYLSQDAFWHLAYVEYITSHGVLDQTPPVLSGGVQGLVSPQPPVVYYLAAFQARLLNLAPRASLILLVGLAFALTPLIWYFCIRRIDRHLALLSLPVMAIIQAVPFASSFAYGHHLLVLGMFFLSLAFYVLYHERSLLGYVLFGIIVAAIALTHTPELVYLALCGALYILASLIFKKMSFRQAGGFVLSFLAGILASIDYLIIFIHSWHDKVGSLIPRIVSYETADIYSYPFSVHFGPYWYVIWLGVLLAVYWLVSHKEAVPEFLPFFLLFFLGFGIHLGYTRFYDVRLYWPIFSSIFFALVVFLIIHMICEKYERVQFMVTAVLSVLLLLVFVAQFNTMIFKGNPLLPESYMNWLLDLKEDLPKDARVLVVTDKAPPLRLLWLINRPPFVLDMEDQENYERVKIGNSSVFKIIPLLERTGDTRQGWIHFSSSQEFQDVADLTEASLCDFDAITIVLFNQLNDTTYWDRFANASIMSGHFRYLDMDDGPAVLINNFPGEPCET